MLLMHENTPVAEVVMQLGHIIRVTKIYNEILLPPGTRKANRGNLSIFMENWQKERAIPFNRQPIPDSAISKEVKDVCFWNYWITVEISKRICFGIKIDG